MKISILKILLRMKFIDLLMNYYDFEYLFKYWKRHIDDEQDVHWQINKSSNLLTVGLEDWYLFIYIKI